MTIVASLSSNGCILLVDTTKICLDTNKDSILLLRLRGFEVSSMHDFCYVLSQGCSMTRCRNFGCGESLIPLFWNIERE